MRTLITNASLPTNNPTSRNPASEDPAKDLVDVLLDPSGILDVGRAADHSVDHLIDAEGAALIPGLHDHHIHLLALKASLDSVKLGPPEVETPSQFQNTLREAAQAGSKADWIRGVGYVESVAGPLSRESLDGIISNKPVRIQHRSGALWILNTRALELLNLDANSSDGCLFRADAWLNERLELHSKPKSEGKQQLELAKISRLLNSFGVTGVTDATPGYGTKDIDMFRDARGRDFSCELILMADTLEPKDSDWIGSRKIILDDFAIPDFADLTEVIEKTHKQNRPVAIHSTTRASLALAAAALKEAGATDGDRIEHASVAPPGLMQMLAELGVTIVTQPNFIAERGDYYLKETEPEDLPWLYRCQGWLDAGVKLAGGTDAPFGSHNPWDAIWAAVNRRTNSAQEIMQPQERLDFCQALKLFLADPRDPGGKPRQIAPGQSADLALLCGKVEAVASSQPKNPVAAAFSKGKLAS